MIRDTQFSFPFTESSSCDPFHKSLSVCGYPHFIHVYLPLNNNSYVDKFCQRPCILRATKNFKLNRFTRFPFFIIILNKLPKKLKKSMFIDFECGYYEMSWIAERINF